MRASSATKLQSAWRGKMARDSYLRVRCSWLASREIQRFYRGHLGRRATRRRREWQSAGPGPERLKLGLRMIEDTKVGWTTRANSWMNYSDMHQDNMEVLRENLHFPEDNTL